MYGVKIEALGALETSTYSINLKTPLLALGVQLMKVNKLAIHLLHKVRFTYEKLFRLLT